MHDLSIYQFAQIHAKKLQVIFGIGLLFLCSQLVIPLQPIPLTLQTVGVMLIGLTYAPREAFYTTFSWLALGLMGLPMFSDYSGGWHVLVGPSAGYLVGFLVAAVVMAQLVECFQSKTLLANLLYSVCGTGIILALGIAWLSISMGSVTKAITVGLIPFIIPGLVKAAFLASTVRLARRAFPCN